jgi:hypothetical protein
MNFRYFKQEFTPEKTYFFRISVNKKNNITKDSRAYFYYYLNRTYKWKMVRKPTGYSCPFPYVPYDKPEGVDDYIAMLSIIKNKKAGIPKYPMMISFWKCFDISVLKQ